MLILCLPTYLCLSSLHILCLLACPVSSSFQLSTHQSNLLCSRCWSYVCPIVLLLFRCVSCVCPLISFFLGACCESAVCPIILTYLVSARLSSLFFRSCSSPCVCPFIYPASLSLRIVCLPASPIFFVPGAGPMSAQLSCFSFAAYLVSARLISFFLCSSC